VFIFFLTVRGLPEISKSNAGKKVFWTRKKCLRQQQAKYSAGEITCRNGTEK
jgi:hypothetical protein